ncbi:hypothetical protein WDZ17_16015 [Pseudokineococcus basanitobsidens]|uniref:FtsX-like permease family protein n=1 Tax=Pseudokineococcus basanitobsidens TaxID=1926649 RepID=A0ABU8RPD3_9ACTN
MDARLLLVVPREVVVSALLALLPLLVLVVALAVGLAVRAAARAPLPAADHPLVRRAALRAGAARWTGAAVGVVAALVLASAGTLGRGPLLAPAALGLGVLAGVLVGELAVRPRRTGVRSASLETRRVRDLLPRPTAAVVAATTVFLLGLLVVTTATASPDDLGRPGRSLAGSCSAGTSFARGPWPGSYYSLPLAVAVLVGLLAAALVLRRVAARPAVGGTPELDEADLVLRRRAGAAVTAAVGVLVSAPLAGVLAVSAGVAGGLDCPSGAWQALTVVLVAALPVSVAVLGWCAAVLLVPGGAVRRASVPA